MKAMHCLLALLFGCLHLVSLTVACNDAVCGPIVTKCQLLKLCGCEMPLKDGKQGCECCSDCAACLEDKYQSCCSCVGLCKPPEPTEDDVNSSSVEDLSDPIPGLFDALTASEQGGNSLWTVVKYPAFESLMHHKNLGVSVDREENIVRFSWDNEILSTAKLENCSVAFVKECTPLSRCKETCKSMGAAKFRWFHDKGCCQCVGDKCIDYGKNYPMCEDCQLDGEDGQAEERYIFDGVDETGV